MLKLIKVSLAVDSTHFSVLMIAVEKEVAPKGLGKIAHIQSKMGCNL